MQEVLFDEVYELCEVIGKYKKFSLMRSMNSLRSLESEYKKFSLMRSTICLRSFVSRSTRFSLKVFL